MMSFENDQEKLRSWFLETKREFAWREAITPYKVLISEVMLQQTRADVVVPYFTRWMEKFPTLEDLAAAPIDEVLKTFEGLGYYSRARNLHKAAQELKNYFPSTYAELLKVPGIGPYTAKAILSFAFQQPVIALDGNVERVLTRYFAHPNPQIVQQKAENGLSKNNPHEIAEALIELGATLCGKIPDCASCPLQKGCQAFQQGRQAEFPLKKVRPAAINVHKKVVIYSYQGRLGVLRRKKGELFADLYMFPEETIEDVRDVETSFSIVRATATVYRFSLAPVLIEVQEPVEGLEFLDYENCLKLPFTSGHRRILHAAQLVFA